MCINCKTNKNETLEFYGYKIMKDCIISFDFFLSELILSRLEELIFILKFNLVKKYLIVQGSEKVWS